MSGFGSSDLVAKALRDLEALLASDSHATTSKQSPKSVVETIEYFANTARQSISDGAADSSGSSDLESVFFILFDPQGYSLLRFMEQSLNVKDKEIVTAKVYYAWSFSVSLHIPSC